MGGWRSGRGVWGRCEQDGGEVGMGVGGKRKGGVGRERGRVGRFGGITLGVGWGLVKSSLWAVGAGRRVLEGQGYFDLSNLFWWFRALYV